MADILVLATKKLSIDLYLELELPYLTLFITVKKSEGQFPPTSPA